MIMLSAINVSSTVAGWSLESGSDAVGQSIAWMDMVFEAMAVDLPAPFGEFLIIQQFGPPVEESR